MPYDKSNLIEINYGLLPIFWGIISLFVVLTLKNYWLKKLDIDPIRL